MNLRDYQLEACEAACRSWDAGNRRVLLTLATGMGKTVIFAALAQSHVAAGKGRALVITPSVELVGQAAAKIHRVTGQMPAIEQASNWSNEEESTRSDYVVACKASLVSKMRDGRKRYERLRDIGLVVVDECHYAATPDYREILDHYDGHVLGVTATPNRHDQVALEEVFHHAPYTMGIREGVDAGWLIAPKTKCLQLQSLDLSKVRSTKGDFAQASLGEAMEGDDVVYEVAEATASEAHGRKTLVFCASVDQAMKVSGVLSDRYGLRSDWVCGDKSRVPDDKREAILSSFTGDPDGVQVVCNVGVLTTGFDFPGLSHIVMARPTKSLPLFTQILGRGTRALDGVVDFEGSTPEARKAAIAASDKPTWQFTDLRDTAMAHKLVTPIDVLGGARSVEVLERAKRRINESDEPQSIDEVLDAADAEEREEAERRRLAKLAATAEFKAIDVDPFVDAFSVQHEAPAKERGARMPFGKHKGELVAKVPRDYLAFMVRKGYIRQPWLVAAVNQRLRVLETA